MTALRTALLVAFLASAPLLVGAAVTPDAATACHGNGVSRACFAYPVRVEAVSYGEGNYNEIYTAADYYKNWNWFQFGDHLCGNYWKCDHGLWLNEENATLFQVYGYHSFKHTTGSAWYSIPGSFTNGQCFPSESGGC
jgi:hypothetical protein